MDAIAPFLKSVKLGEAQSFANLSLFPLQPGEGWSPSGLVYRTLDEALASGCARGTEVSESGSVPELKFANECGDPVLLLDGEELVGAKQNRILNLTILVPAHTSVMVPVSCVEAGRWRAESAEFASADRVLFSRSRANKARQVSASLRESGSRRSDQSAVWEDIDHKMARIEARSPTRAASALHDNRRSSLDEYRRAFTAGDDQVGALFVLNGQAVGLDVFDAPATAGSFKTKRPPAIRGSCYVVEALEAALWAFWHHDSFESGVLAAVNLGDDADTTGAIYGQLAGAYHGVDGIPERWRTRIALGRPIRELADRLRGLAGFAAKGEVPE